MSEKKNKKITTTIQVKLGKQTPTQIPVSNQSQSDSKPKVKK